MAFTPGSATGRPAACPYCKGTVIDTLAKVITPSTFWRCLKCGGTWTIASLERSRVTSAQ